MFVVLKNYCMHAVRYGALQNEIITLFQKQLMCYPITFAYHH